LKARLLFGIVLVLIGVVILYLLRDELIRIIRVVLEVIGIAIGIVCIAAGLGLIFWRRREWYRTGPATRT